MELGLPQEELEGLGTRFYRKADSNIVCLVRLSAFVCCVAFIHLAALTGVTANFQDYHSNAAAGFSEHCLREEKHKWD